MSGYTARIGAAVVSAVVTDGTDGRATFGHALDQLLAERERGRSWLGAEVARIEGSDEPLSGASVSKWVAGNPPAPPRVFAIERALGVSPGTLSRHLGYLPVDTQEGITPRDALRDDPALSPMAKRVMLKVYDELTS